jgi:hypothetical protein
MRAYHNELSSRCAELQQEMDALSNAMNTMQGAGGVRGRGGRRSRGAARRRSAPGGRATAGRRAEGQSLKDYIANVLSSAGAAMRMTDITKGVMAAGYPTRSRNLSNQVSMALAAMTRKRRIRKVGRGLYRG